MRNDRKLTTKGPRLNLTLKGPDIQDVLDEIDKIHRALKQILAEIQSIKTRGGKS
jgi:hypothetical protein